MGCIYTSVQQAAESIRAGEGDLAMFRKTAETKGVEEIATEGQRVPKHDLCVTSQAVHASHVPRRSA